MSCIQFALPILYAMLAATALGGTPAAPGFAKKPAVTKAGAEVKIEFSVDRQTDVAVAIEDARGHVVRHLAAGALGSNAPEPLMRDCLTQQLVWDGADDAGRPAAGGPFLVRVSAGVNPTLDRILGWNGTFFGGSIQSLCVGKEGELYVLFGDPRTGRSEVRVLDAEGKYLRTILPYPADTPPGRTEPIGHLMLDGRRQPMVFNGQGHCLQPLVAGMTGQTMAWHPNGYLLAVSALGTMSEHGPPRHLIAIHPEGGAPEGVGYVGPRVREPRGFMGGAGEGGLPTFDRLATSPDGQYIYFVQDIASPVFQKSGMQHGVFRLKWTDAAAGPLWLGKPAAGPGDDEFNEPQGLAVTREGNLFICDRGNDRVKLYSPQGTLLGKFAVETPEQIAVHPPTGHIFVLSKKAGKNVPTGKLVCFDGWKEQGPRKLAAQDIPGLCCLALDGRSSLPRLWLAVSAGLQRPWALCRATFADGALRIGPSLTAPEGMWYPTFLAVDPARNRLIYKEHLIFTNSRPLVEMDLATGKTRRLKLIGADIAFDAQGNLYATGDYSQNEINRFDPAYQPLPFSATGTNRLDVRHRPYGVGLGLRGHCVAPSGDIYVLRSVNHNVGATVSIYAPDGRLKKDHHVGGLSSGDCGIGVDARGNVYLGMNLKPADQPLPDDFAGKVPAAAWVWWTKGKREPPWSYLYCNPYLFHMGSVLKFGPEGGMVYGYQRVDKDKNNGELATPGCELANTPAGSVAYKSGYLNLDIKVSGARWRYAGIGIVPASGVNWGDPMCVCECTQLDADPYGRVYAPSVFRSAVEMLDAAGNRLARIGAYGNADSAGPGSRVPQPPIAFAWPTVCKFAPADGKLYVSDSVNRRVMVVRLEYATEAVCPVP